MSFDCAQLFARTLVVFCVSLDISSYMNRKGERKNIHQPKTKKKKKTNDTITTCSERLKMLLKNTISEIESMTSAKRHAIFSFSFLSFSNSINNEESDKTTTETTARRAETEERAAN